ncbi:hypothetical protein CAL7102_08708 [Dulcicalothrix desertica PCC 7102]|nr:hypothetical protein CAL7102_08708 [Dulcicalothrix desertica PCC 7102]
MGHETAKTTSPFWNDTIQVLRLEGYIYLAHHAKNENNLHFEQDSLILESMAPRYQKINFALIAYVLRERDICYCHVCFNGSHVTFSYL